MKRFNVVAQVSLLSEVDRPKVDGVRTGYAPHHKFEAFDFLVSGHHIYDDEALHFPGESWSAKILFPSWEHMKSSVSAGDRFEIREMERVVGTGVVTAIEAGSL